MSIYDYNISQATNDLTPPNKRKTNTLAFLGVIGYYLQYLHDLFFNDYANGSSAPDWIDANSYPAGTRLRYIDNKIYEAIIADDGTHAAGVGLNTNPKYRLIINNFIGVRERAKYNSQRVVFEYALNKWFKTTFRQFTGWDGSGNPTPLSDIYIFDSAIDFKSFVVGVDEDESSAVWLTDDEQLQNQVINLDFIFNKFMFTIKIPLAVYDTLLPTDPSGTTTAKDNIVRAFSNNYILGGVNYSITPY